MHVVLLFNFITSIFFSGKDAKLPNDSMNPIGKEVASSFQINLKLHNYFNNLFN